MTTSSPPKTPLRSAMLLIVGSLVVTFLVLEAAARVRVQTIWAPEYVAQLTEPLGPRGPLTPEPTTGYELTPNLQRTDNQGRRFTHNSMGLRGPEVGEKDDGTVRIVLVGGSTVYGIFVDDDDTAARVLERTLNADPDLPPVEVVNAGVSGWTSRETRINYARRLRSLEPDFLVMIDGRNDLFPQVFSNYRPDFSHFRKIPWDFESENALWKRVFKLSHLALVAIGGTERPILGYSRLNEDPSYGFIRFENRPGLDHLLSVQDDPKIFEGWRENVRSVALAAVEDGATPVLVQMPYLAEWFNSGTLPIDAFPESSRMRVREALGSIMAENHAISAGIADELGVPFVPTESVVREQYLYDDCHFNEEGEAAFANLLAQAIRSSMLGE